MLRRHDDLVRGYYARGRAVSSQNGRVDVRQYCILHPFRSLSEVKIIGSSLWKIPRARKPY